MANKIKIFYREMRIGKLEDEVNEFINRGARRIISIQTAAPFSGLAIVVVYEE